MDKYKLNKGIFVPGSFEGQSIRCSSPVPLSILQMMANKLFYQRDDSPLELIGTLGRDDKLLPRALAKEFLENDLRTIHEIGPGNFSFARTFVDAVKPTLDDVVYQTHDFSDSSYVFVKDEVDKYPNIKFNESAMGEVPGKVKDDPIHLVLVEVLDDTLTEYYTLHQGTEYMHLVHPEINSDVVFPTRSQEGRRRAFEEGDYSLTTQRMLKNSIVTKEQYDARDIIPLIEQYKWDELEKIHPAFLKHLKYPDKHFEPISLDDLGNMSWRDMPEEFEDFRKEVIAYFREQLKQIKSDKTGPQTIHIPIDGLNLLWRLKDRKTRIDIFDYGYGSVEEWCEPFSTYNGQITCPVNFDLMRKGAEILGYDTTLEKNREFIKRNLGHDTIPLSYVQRAIRCLGWDVNKVQNLFYTSFTEHIKRLQPDAVVTVDNILSYRIPREEYQGFIDATISAAKEKDMPLPKKEVSEGSYHLAVSKN